MRSNSEALVSPQFRVLTESQLKEIHLASLEILRRTGVDVLEEEARELLKEAGAKVDGNRARIPPALAEWAVRATPSRVVLCDRDGNPALHLEDTRGYYGTGSDTPFTIDPYTGERRKPLLADIANVARVCDYLPNIDFVMCMGIAGDVPEAISDLYHFQAMVTHTRKPLVLTAWNLDNLIAIVEMAEAVAGSPETLRYNPFIAVYTEPISPLQLGLEATQKLLYMAGKGLPVIWTPGQVGGATSPVTLAGSLAIGNAEGLAGLVLTQLKREGAPVIYGGCTLQMDMATTLAAYGSSPEFMLSVTAYTELAHYYDIPVWSYAACSDSKTFDQQAGYEGAATTLLSAVSGGNLIHDVGYLDSGLTSSLESIVVSDEFIGWTKRFMGGIEINQETLALEVIDQVGAGGHFLAEDHTYRHFREDWRPSLFDRNSHESWAERGSKTLGERATETVRQILETHSCEPLPDEVRDTIAEIIGRAERREEVS